MPHFRRSSVSHDEYHNNQHCLEHWYRDNTVYFITARIRGQKRAFESEQAKAIF